MTNEIREKALPMGEKIGVYELRAVIHAGRSGIVYRIWNEHLNAPAALLEYMPEGLACRLGDGQTVGPQAASLKSAYLSGLEAFLRQGQVLSEIEHPNIVRVHNVLRHNGTGYLVMDEEYGLTLSRLVDSADAVAQAELEYILSALLGGLGEVHGRDSYHGDIHPSNILIRKNGEPVLFGFAAGRLSTVSQGKGPESSLRKGYAPPEFYRDEVRPGPSADLYALGATLYRCLVNTDPEAATDRIRDVDQGRPDPVVSGLDSVAENFTGEFIGAIGKMLAIDFRERPQSAREVMALLNIGQGGELAASSAGAQKDKSERAHHREAHWLSSRALIGVVALSLVFLASFMYFQSPDRKPSLRTIDAEKEVRMDAEKEAASRQTVNAAPEAEALRPEKDSEVETSAYDTGYPDIESPDSETATEDSSLQTPDDENTPDSASSGMPVVTMKEQTEPHHDKAAAGEESGSGDIRRSLAAAGEALKNFRLTTPSGDNAYHHYLEVLAIDPEHAEAKKGLQKIVDKYAWLIERAIGQGALHHAEVYADRAEKIIPEDPEIKKLRARIKSANR
ncbi:MAG: serine/threonine protein kinase [Gammaproteobacteria bacterium]